MIFANLPDPEWTRAVFISGAVFLASTALFLRILTRGL